MAMPAPARARQRRRNRYASIFAAPIFAAPIFAAPIFAAPIFAAPIFAAPIFAQLQQSGYIVAPASAQLPNPRNSEAPMFSLAELEAAHRLVHENFPGTPQYPWPLLAARSGAQVWVKHENHTPTGAFKLRGGCGANVRTSPAWCRQRAATMASRWPMPGGATACQ
jgi:hypothetical protein